MIDGGNAMFPPLLRFLPTGLNEKETIASVNQVSFLAGASALALLLILALFLVCVFRGEKNFSLLLLLGAAVILIINPLAETQGFYFLPASFVERCADFPAELQFPISAADIWLPI